MTGLEQWLETPVGQYLLEREYAWFDQSVGDVFGYHAVQLGLGSLDFLRASRMQLKLRSDVDVAVDIFNLPFDSCSIDLAVLPHVLEFSGNPHQILREVARVMRPEGRIMLSGFNPFSLWGIRRLATRSVAAPWCGDFISLARLKDWLALLGFEVAAGKLCCYIPPLDQEKWLNRFSFMEKAGDRWWPISGGVYCLVAIRRVRGMRIIMPSWSDLVANPLATGVREYNKPPCRKTNDGTR
ncbi:MAG TPA: methyltransferase domain-containing protein [Burkholderiales bacterium]|nr:methyltransferase domain-containing protein [Burkholderiales bacterium]